MLLFEVFYCMIWVVREVDEIWVGFSINRGGFLKLLDFLKKYFIVRAKTR